MGAQQIFTRDGFTEHNLYILYDAIFFTFAARISCGIKN